MQPLPTNKDFHDVVTNLILAFLGRERCQCIKTFPQLLIAWDRLNEKEMILYNVPFQCLKLCMHFEKSRVNLFLLEIELLETTLCYKYDKLIISFKPINKRCGHVTLQGSPHAVRVIHDDILLLLKHFKYYSKKVTCIIHYVK